MSCSHGGDLSLCRKVFRAFVSLGFHKSISWYNCQQSDNHILPHSQEQALGMDRRRILHEIVVSPEQIVSPSPLPPWHLNKCQPYQQVLDVCLLSHFRQHVLGDWTCQRFMSFKKWHLSSVASKSVFIKNFKNQVII